MTIALPDANGTDFLRSLMDIHARAVAIRDQTGDLAWRHISDIDRADAVMRSGISALQQDAQSVPAKVLSFLQDRGATITSLPDALTKVQTLNAALTAWRSVVVSTVAAMTGSQILEIRETNYQGETMREISMRAAIPAAQATPLRSSQELTNLIAALEALGA